MLIVNSPYLIHVEVKVRSESCSRPAHASCSLCPQFLVRKRVAEQSRTAEKVTPKMKVAHLDRLKPVPDDPNAPKCCVSELPVMQYQKAS
jgi:hypothetical protein